MENYTFGASRVYGTASVPDQLVIGGRKDFGGCYSGFSIHISFQEQNIRKYRKMTKRDNFHLLC